MSNRKKPTNRKLIAQRALSKVEIPDQESVVLKKVPAVIHWRDVPSVERDDDEIIGEAVIYEDMTQDVIIFEEISEEAKNLVYGVSAGIDYYSISEEEADGPPKQE